MKIDYKVELLELNIEKKDLKEKFCINKIETKPKNKFGRFILRVGIVGTIIMIIKINYNL